MQNAPHKVLTESFANKHFSPQFQFLAATREAPLKRHCRQAHGCWFGNGPSKGHRDKTKHSTCSPATQLSGHGNGPSKEYRDKTLCALVGAAPQKGAAISPQTAHACFPFLLLSPSSGLNMDLANALFPLSGLNIDSAKVFALRFNLDSAKETRIKPKVLHKNAHPLDAVH